MEQKMKITGSLTITVLKVAENDYEKMVLDTFRFVPLVGDKAW